MQEDAEISQNAKYHNSVIFRRKRIITYFAFYGIYMGSLI